MTATRILRHRDVQFVIAASHDDEGFYAYEIDPQGIPKRGRKEARLFELAVREVEIEIDRLLRKQGVSSSSEDRREESARVLTSSNAQ